MVYPEVNASSPAVEVIELPCRNGISAGHALPQAHQVMQRHHIYIVRGLLPAEQE